MTEDEPHDHHGDVVSSLLDLQRRLRGGDTAAPPAPVPPPPAERHPSTPPPPDRPRDQVEVVEGDVTVREPAGERFASVTQLPTTAGDDRLAALSDRLGRLEADLTGVLGSIATVSGDVNASAQGVEARLDAMLTDTETRIDAVRAETEARLEAARRDADERSARMLAERLAALSDRLTEDIVVQRRDLVALIDRRIGSMQEALRATIREVAGHAPGSDAPG